VVGFGRAGRLCASAGTLGAEQREGGTDGQERHDGGPHEGVGEGVGHGRADPRPLARRQRGEQAPCPAGRRQGGRALVLENDGQQRGADRAADLAQGVERRGGRGTCDVLSTA
jgi:hypothetical protein